MKLTAISLTMFAAAALANSLQAAPVVINSPTHRSTLSESSVYRSGLHWDERAQRMTAVLTFSNENYATDTTQRHDDTFAFLIPGVQYDSVENVFYAVAANGHRTPFAKFSPMLFGKVIQLLPGSTVYVERSYGNISVKLVKTEPNGEPHWKEIAMPNTSI